MPSKNRHGRGKHPHRSKRSKAMQRQGAATLHPAAVEAPKTAAAIKTPPVAKAAAAPVKMVTNPYPYVVDELKKIGILAGIILVILIVLSVILS